MSPIVVGSSAPPAVTGLGVSGGFLIPTSGVLKRIYHAARGFEYSDVAVTIRHRVNTTAPGADYQAGVIARRLDGANQIVAYVSNTQLFLRKRDGGVMTDLVAPLTIGTLAANTDYWLRLICDGNALRAEHWATQPTPLSAGTAAVLEHTLVSGDATKFGASIEGDAGIWWQPGAGFADARLDSFRAEPYTYRNQTLPRSLTLRGRVPGDLPALCDLHVTPSGGANAPIFGLFGWTPRPVGVGWGVAPFGVIEAETAGSLANMAAGANAGALGGTALATTVAAPNTAAAWWATDARSIPPDEDGSLMVEVFARIWVSGAATWTLWADPRDGSSYGARRYGDRGSGGLTPPSATAGAWRIIRLGRIRLGGMQRLGIDLSWNTGTAYIDYLVLVLARSFVSSPMGVSFDPATYPRFVATTAESVRVLLSDGSATLAPPTQAEVPLREHGLGRRIELPPGNVDLVGKLSSLVVDRPESDAATEQLTHAATVRAAVLPRFAFA